MKQMTLEEAIAQLTNEQIQAIYDSFPADLDNAELVQNFVCDLGEHLENEAFGRGFYLHLSKEEDDAIAKLTNLLADLPPSQSSPE